MRTTTIGSRGSMPSSSQDAVVGLEVGQVVLLLETGIAAELAVGAVAVEAPGRDHVGNDDGLGEATVDVVLDGRPLVVEHRRAGDPQQAGGDTDVVGAVAEREVEAAPAAPADHLDRPLDQTARLRGERATAMATDRRVLDPEAVAELEGLREVPGCDGDVVAVGLEASDDRRHHEDVGTVR